MVVDEVPGDTEVWTDVDAVIDDTWLFGEETAVSVVVPEAIAEVIIAVPAFSQGEITHCEASALSINRPFCFEGVKLRV